MAGGDFSPGGSAICRSPSVAYGARGAENESVSSPGLGRLPWGFANTMRPKYFHGEADGQTKMHRIQYQMVEMGPIDRFPGICWIR